MDTETIRAYADLGVDRIITPAFGRDADELQRWIDEFHATVMSRLA